MQLWKLKSFPSASWEPRKASGVVSVQIWVPENQKSWCDTSQSEPEGWRTRSRQCPRRRGDGCPTSSRKQIHPPSTFLLYFIAHLHWWGRSSLLSLLIHMLTSSGNTLTNTHRNNVLSAVSGSLSTIKLMHKISHHNDHIKSNKFLVLSLIHQYLLRDCVQKWTAAKWNYFTINLFRIYYDLLRASKEIMANEGIIKLQGHSMSYLRENHYLDVL